MTTTTTLDLEAVYYSKVSDALLAYDVLAYMLHLQRELDADNPTWLTIGERQDLQDAIDMTKELERRLMAKPTD